MNRKLLFLGIILSLFAILSSTVILFVTEASNNTFQNFAFHNALQLHLFHTVMIFFLATIKRKYTDKNLVITGLIFTFSIFLFATPAYIGMLSEIGNFVLNSSRAIGALGFIIGWVLLLKTFYDMFFSKNR